MSDLVRLIKRKFQQNFDKLKLESVTFKRQQQERKVIKIIMMRNQLESIFKRKQLLNKSNAMQQLKQFSRSASHRTIIQQAAELQSQLQTLTRNEYQLFEKSMLSRDFPTTNDSGEDAKRFRQLRQRALSKLSVRIQQRLTRYFFKWKLITQLWRQ